MRTLFILNDPPYGSERSYNALRFVRALVKRPDTVNEAKIFLMGDAASCAKNAQKVPPGYYNIGDMLGMIARRHAEIGVCGTCMDARGIADKDLIEGALRSSMSELAQWTEWADKVIVF